MHLASPGGALPQATKAWSSGLSTSSEPQQVTRGSKEGERELGVASLVFCCPACVECLALGMISTGLNFPMPKSLSFFYLRCLAVWLQFIRQARPFVHSPKDKRIITKMRMTGYYCSLQRALEEARSAMKKLEVCLAKLRQL